MYYSSPQPLSPLHSAHVANNPLSQRTYLFLNFDFSIGQFLPEFYEQQNISGKYLYRPCNKFNIYQCTINHLIKADTKW
jgi:hypothetical protein